MNKQQKLEQNPFDITYIPHSDFRIRISQEINRKILGKDKQQDLRSLKQCISLEELDTSKKANHQIKKLPIQVASDLKLTNHIHHQQYQSQQLESTIKLSLKNVSRPKGRSKNVNKDDSPPISNNIFFPKTLGTGGKTGQKSHNQVNFASQLEKIQITKQIIQGSQSKIDLAQEDSFRLIGNLNSSLPPLPHTNVNPKALKKMKNDQYNYFFTVFNTENAKEQQANTTANNSLITLKSPEQKQLHSKTRSTNLLSQKYSSNFMISPVIKSSSGFKKKQNVSQSTMRISTSVDDLGQVNNELVIKIPFKNTMDPKIPRDVTKSIQVIQNFLHSPDNSMVNNNKESSILSPGMGFMSKRKAKQAQNGVSGKRKNNSQKKFIKLRTNENQQKQNIQKIINRLKHQIQDHNNSYTRLSNQLQSGYSDFETVKTNDSKIEEQQTLLQEQPNQSSDYSKTVTIQKEFLSEIINRLQSQKNNIQIQQIDSFREHEEEEQELMINCEAGIQEGLIPQSSNGYILTHDPLSRTQEMEMKPTSETLMEKEFINETIEIANTKEDTKCEEKNEVFEKQDQYQISQIPIQEEEIVVQQNQEPDLNAFNKDATNQSMELQQLEQDFKDLIMDQIQKSHRQQIEQDDDQDKLFLDDHSQEQQFVLQPEDYQTQQQSSSYCFENSKNEELHQQMEEEIKEESEQREESRYKISLGNEAIKKCFLDCAIHAFKIHELQKQLIKVQKHIVQETDNIISEEDSLSEDTQRLPKIPKEQSISRQQQFKLGTQSGSMGSETRKHFELNRIYKKDTFKIDDMDFERETQKKKNEKEEQFHKQNAQKIKEKHAKRNTVLLPQLFEAQQFLQMQLESDNHPKNSALIHPDMQQSRLEALKDNIRRRQHILAEQRQKEKLQLRRELMKKKGQI